MPESTDPPQGDPGAQQPGGRDGAGNGEGGAGSREAILADLARERDKRQAAEREAKRVKELEKQLEELRAQSMTESEKAVAEALKKGREEAFTAMNSRLVAANVRAAAAGRLADPEDAVRFIDLSEFKVGDGGEVDEKAVRAAVDKLLKDKPYLAGGGRPTGGGADQGARGTGQGPTTMNDLIRSAIGNRR